MAILDGLLTVDNQSALTTSRASTDTIDLTVARDLNGLEGGLELLFAFNTLPTAAGAATVTVEAQTSPDNATWTTASSSGAVPIAQFTARRPGGGIRLAFPAAVARYVRLNYVIGTGPLTAGTITASFVLQRDNSVYYARNYAV